LEKVQNSISQYILKINDIKLDEQTTDIILTNPKKYYAIPITAIEMLELVRDLVNTTIDPFMDGCRDE